MDKKLKSITLYKLQQVKEKDLSYHAEQLEKDKTITHPIDCARIIENILNLSKEAVENFGILCLNTKNNINAVHIISIGTLNSSIVHPREVFTKALLNNSNSIIAFHNHPSGDPTPSQEDINITKKLVKVGEILGIKLLDHIIIGSDNRYCSIKQEGYI